MKTRLIRTSLMVAVALLATGCSVYNGTTTDIPLFQERGELQLEGAFVPSPTTPPFLVLPFRGTASYSLTNRVGVSGSFDLGRGAAQLMGGVYNPVGERFVWELYGGMAMGQGGKRDADHVYSCKGHYLMPFVQADCGWRDLTRWLHLDVAFALRAGAIYGQTNYSYYQYYMDGSFVELTDHFAGMRPLLEPSIEVRFGWEDLKFNLRYYRIFIIGNSRNHAYNLQDIPTQGAGIGAGLSYRF